jgi:hypothetical protein
VAVEESFNPYRKWFGIPIKEQPPHHYRLLGLEPLEEDLDAIVNALDTKMTFLKGQLSGAQHAEADRLIEELTGVQAVLLDPEKKTAYDTQLQSQLPVQRSSDAFVVPPLPSTKKTPLPFYRRSSVIASSVVAAAIVLGFLIALPFLNNAGQQAPETNAETAVASRRQARIDATGQTAASGRKNGPGSPLPEKLVGHPETSTNQKNHQATISPATREKPSAQPSTHVGDRHPAAEEPPWEDTFFSQPSDLAKESSPQTAPPPIEEPEDGQATTTEPDESSEQPGVPSEAERREAEKTILKTYAKRIAAAKTGRDKLALARDLWNQGSGYTGTAAERYALLRLSLHLTAEAGQLHQALADTENLAKKFPTGVAALKVEVVCRVIQALRAGEKSVNPFEIVAVSPAVIEEARLSGCFEEAGRLLQMVIPLARQSKDQNVIRDLSAQGREIEKLKAQSASLRRAMDTLRDHPDDVEAQRLAGRWISFQLRDWKRGLALLAKSSDPALGKLAGDDLANPRQPARQAELADDYREAAQKEPAMMLRPGILARAEYWYRKALPGLAEVAKIQVTKRLEEIVAERQAQKGVRGAVQPGNVALARNGTRVEGVESGAMFLLDGQSQFSSPPASSPLPCQWTIVFNKVYQLQEIRFKLDEQNRRNFFRYIVAISADGMNFQPVAVRTQGQWFGWQQVRIPAQPVKAVRLMGVFASQSQRFIVNEFEAYCITPKP